MGLLSYLRGDSILADSTKSESRSLPAPENQLPLSGLPTIRSGPSHWKLRPSSPGIAVVWVAVRVLADADSILPLHFYRKLASPASASPRSAGDLLEARPPASARPT